LLLALILMIYRCRGPYELSINKTCRIQAGYNIYNKPCYHWSLQGRRDWFVCGR